MEAFPNSLTILTSENNVHFYKVKFERKLKGKKIPGTEIEYRPPKKIKLIDVQMTGVSAEYSWLKTGDAKPLRGRLDETGQLILDPKGDRLLPIPQIEELEKTLGAVIMKSQLAIEKGEKPPYDNVIIDEWGEFMDRAYAEILPTCVTDKGKQDTRGAFMETGKWVFKIANWLKQLIPCGVGVVLVMHDREPEEGKMGGPKAPSANIATKLVAQCDGAIQLVMQDPKFGEKDAEGKPAKPRRVWKATASEKWNIGLRGLMPEDEDLIANMELHEILKLAGFSMEV